MRGHGWAALAMLCALPMLAAARCGGDARRAPAGPFTLRIEHRGGVEVVHNGTTPLYADGAAKAEVVWRHQGADPFGYRDLGIGPDSIYMITSRTRSLVSMPRRGGSPRVLVAGLWGAHDTGWGEGSAWVVDDPRVGGPRLWRMPRAGHPATTLRLPVDDAGPLALTDSGLVVRTYRPDDGFGWLLLRRDGTARPLPFPAATDTTMRGGESCAKLASLGVQVEIFACGRPLFRRYALDGRPLREVVMDGWAPPPRAGEPGFAFLFPMRDPANGIYGLIENEGNEYDPGDTVLHLFSPEGVYLARIRFPNGVGSAVLDHGELYLITGTMRRIELIRYALRLPPGALDSAHAAYVRARGTR